MPQFYLVPSLALVLDPERIAVGFSDGAYYAISLGITNEDLVRHTLAFSPGFIAPAATVGSPCVFVSHGTHGAALPIDRCRHRLVPELKRAGYDVTGTESLRTAT